MNFLGTTLCWCNLAVQDKRLSFDAFKNKYSYPLYWMVLDDGVHVRAGDQEFFTRWN
ncbi:hypothetical protein LINPERHAP2_LOCUS42482 [Linum perenne]